MTDIVERLRELAGQTDAYANNRHHSFVTTQQMARESAAALAEAADEIERLREALQQIDDLPGSHAEEALLIASAVLEDAPPPLDAQRDNHQSGESDDDKLVGRHSSSTSISIKAD